MTNQTQKAQRAGAQLAGAQFSGAQLAEAQRGGAKRLVAVAFGLSALVSGAGCVVSEPDHERFTQAIPQGSSVAVAGPGASEAEGTQSTAPGARVQGEGLPEGPWAESYALTREVRGGINEITGGVLGSIWWLVTEVPPTEVTADEATWGPYQDALKPSITRFRVKALGGDKYEYVLEGRPKSQPDSPYLTVMIGTGYGRVHAEHGNGQFSIDLDAARTLDPFEHQDDGTGSVVVEHWLAGDTHRIVAEHQESDSERFARAESEELPDGTGTLYISGRDNLEDSATDALETITLSSQWRADGAGRADYSFADGDVPGIIEVTECWDPSFLATYFVSGPFAEGDVQSCAFQTSVARD